MTDTKNLIVVERLVCPGCESTNIVLYGRVVLGDQSLMQCVECFRIEKRWRFKKFELANVNNIQRGV